MNLSLEDDPVNSWEECVVKNSEPLVWNVSTEKIGETARLDNLGLSNSMNQVNLINILTSKEGLAGLRDPNFQPIEFVRRLYQRKNLESFRNLVGTNEPIKDMAGTIFANVSQNLLAIMDAYNSVSNSNRQNYDYERMLLTQLDNTKKELDSFYKEVFSFFGAIKDKSKGAYDSSQLLKRIQTYSSLFSLSTEIDTLRKTGQFEDVARLLEKSKEYQGLENLSLCSTALKSVGISIKKVEDSIWSRIRTMTVEKFNPKYVKLYMDIKKDATPIVTLIDEYRKTSLENFSSRDIDEGCRFVEEVIPFWSTLFSFGLSTYPTIFKSLIKESDMKLEKFITSVSDESTKQLQSLLFPGGGGFSVFNPKLHNYVRRTDSMWQAIIDQWLPEAKRSKMIVLTSRTKLMNWYANVLTVSHREISTNPKPVRSIVEYLTDFLQAEKVTGFPNYTTVVFEPIMRLYDSIHENATDDECKLAETAEELGLLIKGDLHNVVSLYKTRINSNCDPEYKEAEVVGVELRKILCGNLIRMASYDIEQLVYTGIVQNKSSWDGYDDTIECESWASGVLARVIKCKSTWGSVFNDLRDQLINSVISSIYFALKHISSVKPSGYLRLELSISFLRYALYTSSNESRWRSLFSILEEKIKDPPTVQKDNLMKAIDKAKIMIFSIQTERPPDQVNKPAPRSPQPSKSPNSPRSRTRSQIQY